MIRYAPIRSFVVVVVVVVVDDDEKHFYQQDTFIEHQHQTRKRILTCYVWSFDTTSLKREFSSEALK